MNKYLLETSAIINYFRDKEGAVELIENLSGELTSSFVCLAELYEGIFMEDEKEDAEEYILTFFTGLSKVYGLDQEIAREFGQVRAQLKGEGKVIEDIDIIVAATCLAYNLALVTYNSRHFKRVKGLKILPTSKNLA